jgi:sulfur dioxygenase
MTIIPFLSSRGAISYLIIRENNRAILIDPNFEMAEKIMIYIKQNSVALTHILETHTHADFFSSRDLFQKLFPQALVRKPFENVSIENLQTIPTPGHTNDSVCYIFEQKYIFTGDTLLIGGTGRTDFQEGSSNQLFESLSTILNLPLSITIYPNHNYNNLTETTLLEQTTTNPRLKLVNENKKQEFIQLMDNHKPPKPDLFEEAILYNSHNL